MKPAGSVLLVLTLVVASTSRGDGNVDTAVLRPESPIQRGIRAAETHRYDLSRAGSARDALPRVTVTQNGIDVVVVALDRDGGSLGQFNAPLERFDRESFLLPGETTRIEIRPLPGSMPAGEYSLVLEFLSAEDRNPIRLRAATRMSEAALVMRDAPNKDLSLAAELYEAAATDWATLGERLQEARALFSAATYRRIAGQPERSYGLYGRAVESAQELGATHGHEPGVARLWRLSRV